MNGVTEAERGILPHAVASVNNRGRVQGGAGGLREVRRATRITVHTWEKKCAGGRREKGGVVGDRGRIRIGGGGGERGGEGGGGGEGERQRGRTGETLS